MPDSSNANSESTFLEAVAHFFSSNTRPPCYPAFFSALSMLTCKQCPENFKTDSSRGLSLHQNKCPAFIRQTQNIFNARRTLGSHKSKQRSTLKDRKRRLQDNDATVQVGAENRVCRHNNGILIKWS